MPIKIPDQLPAKKTLLRTGVSLITESDAIVQNIRPLQIAILNLMPDKISTELQLTILLGYSPLQIEVTLITPASHTSKTTPQSHLVAFYKKWSDVRTQKFDGLIITGAPVETIDFKDVFYWEELKEIFEWSQTHVTMTFDICWAAQAALKYFYDVDKYLMDKKISGIFAHNIVQEHSWLIAGINDDFLVPVSRYSTVKAADILKIENLNLLVTSAETGPCLIEDKEKRHIYMFNHLEYDSGALGREYYRDLEKNLKPELPKNYFLDDDPKNEPVNVWRSTAHLMFRNWIDRVYAETEFDRTLIGNNDSKTHNAIP